MPLLQVLDLINAKAGMLPSAFKPLTAEQIAFLAKEDEDVRVTEEQVGRHKMRQKEADPQLR